MTTITDLITEYRTQIRDTVPVPWQPSTKYTVGQMVIGQTTMDGTFVYQCISPGTSAASGGPSGVTTPVTDGSVVWAYYNVPWSPALSDVEITQFITDGLRTYSRYRPRKRSITINVVSGQPEYSLPTDWIDREYDSFDCAINPPPLVDPMRLSPFTFISAAQLMARPMAAYEKDVQYDFYPDDLQMVITPEPQSSYSLTFDYFAYHTADVSSCTIPYMDIDNALLPGLVKGIRSIAMDYSVKLQMYMMSNNIQVDNRNVSNNLLARAAELEKQFERDIIKRPIAVMG